MRQGPVPVTRPSFVTFHGRFDDLEDQFVGQLVERRGLLDRRVVLIHSFAVVHQRVTVSEPREELSEDIFIHAAPSQLFVDPSADLGFIRPKKFISDETIYCVNFIFASAMSMSSSERASPSRQEFARVAERIAAAEKGVKGEI